MDAGVFINVCVNVEILHADKTRPDDKHKEVHDSRLHKPVEIRNKNELLKTSHILFYRLDKKNSKNPTAHHISIMSLLFCFPLNSSPQHRLNHKTHS